MVNANIIRAKAQGLPNKDPNNGEKESDASYSYIEDICDTIKQLHVIEVGLFLLLGREHLEPFDAPRTIAASPLPSINQYSYEQTVASRPIHVHNRSKRSCCQWKRGPAQYSSIRCSHACW